MPQSENVRRVTGLFCVPVFVCSQTEGAPLPGADEEAAFPSALLHYRGKPAPAACTAGRSPRKAPVIARQSECDQRNGGSSESQP